MTIAVRWRFAAATAAIVVAVAWAAAGVASHELDAPLRVGAYALFHRPFDEGGVAVLPGMIKVAFSSTASAARRTELVRSVGGSFYALQIDAYAGPIYFVRVSAREVAELAALCDRLKATGEVNFAGLVMRLEFQPDAHVAAALRPDGARPAPPVTTAITG